MVFVNLFDAGMFVAAAAKKLGNAELERANEYAFTAGMERSLIADYKILETELAKGALGNAFFLVMYKRITAKQDKVIIEYVRMAETSPVGIPIERTILE